MFKTIFHKTISTISICFLFGILALGQNPDSLVWPGDVNNNGIVNHVDLLYLGSAFNAEGSSRDLVSTDWQGMSTPMNWNPALFSDEFPSFAFADCDGDGLVQEADIEAIINNYGETHDSLYSEQFFKIPGAFSELYFSASSAIEATAGGEYFVDIFLGDENSPIEHFYGAAFKFNIDTEFLDMDSFSFAPDNTWMDPEQNGLLEIQKYNGNSLEIALCRKNQSNTAGGGKIGTARFIIVDDVPGFAGETEVISIEEAYVVNNTLDAYQQVYGGSVFVDFTNPIENPIKPSGFKIYPNPSNNGIFKIKGLEDYESISIMDIAGRRQKFTLNHNELKINNISNGIYFMEIITSKGKWTERLIIQN